MTIGIGFANDEYNEKTVEDYYKEELDDAPIGIGGFVRDVCYEKAIERYFKDKKERASQTKEQGFI